MGHFPGAETMRALLRRDLNIRNVLIKLESWAQCWACRSNSQNNTAELAWNVSCYLTRDMGRSGGCHGTVGSKSPSQQPHKASDWALLLKSPTSPLPDPTCQQQERENSREIALAPLVASRSYVIASTSTCWVLIPELSLQGNIGKWLFFCLFVLAF